MDFQIAESIMGHWFKGKSVNDRYGYIDGQEFIRAIDCMTFDHGETVILARKKQAPLRKNVNILGTWTPPKKKRLRTSA